jgi:RNA-binding protein YhbY
MIDYSLLSHPPLPIYEIGTDGIINITNKLNIFAEEHELTKVKICSICCGRGKIEKQGLFGIIRLVKCKCKNRR